MSPSEEPRAPRTSRMRLSLSEKAGMVRLLRLGASKSYMQSQFSCSRRTVFHIQKNRDKVLQQAETSRSLPMKSLMKPKYHTIETCLYDWMQIARSAKLSVNDHTISAKALNISDNLLEEEQDTAERSVIKKFSAAQSWIVGFVSWHALRSLTLHGKAGAVRISDVAGGITELLQALQCYKPEFIFNMDETGLFYKLFPKRTYVLPGENKETLRGIKEMGAKNRINTFVSNNANGTLKLPMATIGKANNPRCFRKGPPVVPYYSQKNAWSDTVTFRKWFTTCFLPFIRKRTSEAVALVMDNCGPHGADLVENNEQVTIYTLPPNCTAVYQPMDMGVIAAFKLRYRRLLLTRIASTMEERNKLQEAAKHLTVGMRGLDEVHDPHILDVTELVKQAWDEISERTIARCWVKYDIQPRDAHIKIEVQLGKVRRGRTPDKEHFLQMAMLTETFNNLKLVAPLCSDVVMKMKGIYASDLEQWAFVEDIQDVKEATVHEAFIDLEKSYRLGAEEAASDVEEVEENVTKNIRSLVEITEAFREAQTYVDNAGVPAASDAVRRAKRILFDAFHKQNKKQKTQTLIVEYSGGS